MINSLVFFDILMAMISKKQYGKLCLKVILIKLEFDNSLIINKILVNTKVEEKIKLAISWNRLNDAKSSLKELERNYEQIFKSSQNKKSLESFDEKSEKLHYLLEIALLENKARFVSLLLQHGISLDKFLYLNRLTDLYNNEAVSIINMKGTL